MQEKAMKHEKEVWQSDGRKEIALKEAEMLKEYERVRLEEEKVKSEQIRAAREVRRVEEKAMKHEKEVWQSNGRKEIALKEAEMLKEYVRVRLEADAVKSEQLRVARANRRAEEKAMKHEKEVWQSESRKEVIAAEAARLKAYEEAQLKESFIKSEQFRVARDVRKAAEKAMKHEKQVWQSDGRKEIIAAEAKRLKAYEEAQLEEARIKSEQLRAAREIRLAAEKIMKHEKEVWQSDGRKEIIAAEAARLKAYEEAELKESLIKSNQFRAVRHLLHTKHTFVFIHICAQV